MIINSESKFYIDFIGTIYIKTPDQFINYFSNPVNMNRPYACTPIYQQHIIRIEEDK